MFVRAGFIWPMKLGIFFNFLNFDLHRAKKASFCDWKINAEFPVTGFLRVGSDRC